ncbi:7941_t:CDS:2, partial [Entrophospora sp. SA101]
RTLLLLRYSNSSFIEKKKLALNFYDKNFSIMSSNSSQDHKLCMIPGPVEFHDDVLRSIATPATSHVSPAFINAFSECFELLRKLFITKSAQPFVVSGSGTLGWDMVSSNLIEPGEDVLVLHTGYFATQLKADIGDRPSLEDISSALDNKRYKAITITHVDTSTGVLSDIKNIAQLVRQKSPDTLIIVDGVCSVGSEEIRVDEWGLDIVMTASQKGIGVPPGLSILQVFKKRKSPITSYYASWANWLPIMNAYETRKGMYFATPPVQLIYALHASLKQIMSVPIETRFEQHKQASASIKKAVEELGLKFVPKSKETSANGMTAVYYPDGIAATDLLPKVSSHDVVIAGGLHKEIATKYFRIGHMGVSVTEPERKHVEKTIEALRLGLKELGYS